MRVEVFLHNRAVRHIDNISEEDAKRLLTELGGASGLVELPDGSHDHRVFIPVGQVGEVRVFPEGQPLPAHWPK